MMRWIIIIIIIIIIIREGITVISLRMLALRQFVCFYSDVLLKRAQCQKLKCQEKESP